MKKIILFIISAVIIFVFIPMAVVKLPGSKSKSSIIAASFSENSTKIMVFKKKENKKELMDLEEYIEGVVAQEMPADFQLEALKAQAVAARTFAYGRLKNIYGDREVHKDCDVCTDHTHCQAWIDREDFVKEYDNNRGNELWRKIESAVYDTKGVIITYKGKVANPLYHSNSGGLTESVQDVWQGEDVPYLKSVVSLGEDLGSKFVDNKLMKPDEFLKKLGIEKKYTIRKVMDSIKYDRSPTGRVKNITILGVSKKGTDFRTIYNICSTNFSIQNNKGLIEITTHGFGHGVGMSQWGANYLALNGGNYIEILKHYYTGIDLEVIK